jgi:hypothetical protein
MERKDFRLTPEAEKCEMGPEKGGAPNCSGKAALTANGRKVCAECAFYAAEGEEAGALFSPIPEHAEDGERR